MTVKHLSFVAAISLGLAATCHAQGAGTGGGSSAGSAGNGTAASTTSGPSVGVGNGTASTAGAVGAGTSSTIAGPAVPGSDVGTHNVGPSGVAVPDGTTTGMNPNAAVPPGSPAAAQAARNAGAGRAPNGVPIGSPGSGLGSPENPIDPRTN